MPSSARWTHKNGHLPCFCFRRFSLPSLNHPPNRAAVRLASCRGKTWDAAKPAALGPLAVSGRIEVGWERGSFCHGLPLAHPFPPPPPPTTQPKDASVPQAWFLHFYALGSVACAGVLEVAVKAAAAAPLPPPPAAAAALAALTALQLHLLRRLLECALQARYPRGARMHALAYAFGMSYYAVLPLSMLPGDAFGEAAAWVGRGGGPPPPPTLLSRFIRVRVPPSTPTAVAASVAAALSPAQWVGVAAFVGGSALQAASHAALARLQARAAASNTPYLLPTAGVLTLCACPHYLGEIVVYVGLALIAAPTCTAPPTLALVWVTANLVMGAADARDWYRRQFGRAFPVGRAALVPGLY